MAKDSLRMENVSASYGAIQALHDVSLNIAQGEIITLIGANGAGKTTTLMTVSGAVRATSGTIHFQGDPIHALAPNKIVSRGLIQVPEGRLIFPELTVMENLDMGAFLRNDKAGIKEDLDYVLELFPILGERKKQQGGTLSGGEQQMLAISRALMARPKLLLLDEPSLGLAPLIIKRIFQIITRINQESGTTIFLVEQNAHQALKIAHRAYVMVNGRITMADDAANLLANEDIKKEYLGL